MFIATVNCTPLSWLIAVGAVYGKIFDAKRERIQAEIEARNRVMSVLTEEQRAQLHGMHHQPHQRHHSQA